MAPTRAGYTLNARWDASKVVMGGSSDVKVEAILQVGGILTAHNILTAGRVVVLTGFVQVKNE